MGYWQEVIVILINLGLIIDYTESKLNKDYNRIYDKKIVIVTTILNVLMFIKHIL